MSDLYEALSNQYVYSENSMAKKARCFEVNVRDGHTTKSRIIPAQSKAELLNRLDIPENEKLMGITHLGHHPFQAAPDEDDRYVKFHGTVKGREVEVHPDHQGYGYLQQHFPDQVKDVETYLKEQYD